jgi:hypothetical protein
MQARLGGKSSGAREEMGITDGYHRDSLQNGFFMFTLINSLLTLNLLALVVLIWRLQALRRRNEILSRAISELAPVAATTPPDLAKTLVTGTADIIAIEILNPVELARNESWLAGVFGTLTPALVRKIVSEQALKNVHTELLKWGVKADVKLHRVGR